MVSPVLITSIPESATFALRFAPRETKESATQIAKTLFDLLLSKPNDLGVFSEYFVRLWDPSEVNVPSSYEVALYNISCNGQDFAKKFVGYLRPEQESDDEIDQINAETAESCDMLWIRDVPVWPFALPTRRAKHGKPSR